MNRKQQIAMLKYYRDMLLLYQTKEEVHDEKPKEKQKQKVLVLTNRFHGRDVRVGFDVNS